MVQTISVVALWSLLACCIESANGQIATFTPQNPKIGDVIIVTYAPGARVATIKIPTDLTLQTLILPEVGTTPVLIETPLQKADGLWKGSFTLQQKEARFLLHQFVSGDLRDDNVEQGWESLVVGSDGKALKGGHYWRGAVVAFGGYMGFKYHKNVMAAKAELTHERKLYPEDYYASNLAWYLETNPAPTEAGVARVKKELEEALRYFRYTEEALPMLLVWLEQTGQKPKADSLRQMIVAENPNGRVASVTRLREISKERDPAKRCQILEQYVAEVPMKEDELLAIQRQLLMAYVQAEQYDKAFGLLKSVPKLDPALYRNVASPMVEKGMNLDKAIQWLAEGIDIVRKQDESSKPHVSTKAEWKKTQTSTLASLLDTRGLGLSKLGKKDEAETALAEAYKLTNGEDLLITSNLMDAYVKNESFKKAEEIGLDCLRRGKTNQSIVEKFRTAYAKVHGSMAGYDKAVQEARAQEQDRLLKSGINKPAPDFSLRDMKGAAVKLSGLRGKVVVLDFWATWCGPCKASFPHLQKVFEVYKDYRNVAFLAMNTSEVVVGAARDSLVKKFVTDNKCTFPVVYDEGYTYAQKLGVEGIPAVVVIDRQRNIQFKTVGFSNGEEMVGNLVRQIEVLLKH